MAGQQHPTLDVERQAWSAGARWVAGVDEVGRGALAGPVVAAAVILPPDAANLLDRLADVRDSKVMTPSSRNNCYPMITDAAVGIGVGALGPLAIDVLGIGRATQLAMSRAVGALPVVPDVLLVDGVRMPLLRLPQQAYVGGDGSVLSIAAASVVAKLYRDAQMIKLAGQLPHYGFDGHKGYGTERHRRALAEHGPSRHHRLTWRPLQSLLPLRVVTQLRLPGLADGSVAAASRIGLTTGGTL